MTTTTNANAQSLATVRQPFTTGAVTSRDGTIISYRQLGHGPGIVLLHGAMESAQSHMQLAEALADAFTLYLPDRRGRGRSGAYGANYSMQAEVEDVAALLSQTGAQNIFGVSAGGLIALQAALTLPAIRKLALYEPALVIDGSISTAFVSRYDRELAQGNLAAALVTGMKGAQMGPPIFNAMPRWLLESFTRMAIKQEDAEAQADAITMRKLAPTLHYDFQLVSEMADTQARFSAMRTPTLLLGGSKSPRYLKRAVDTLAQVLPDAQQIVFPGLDHGGSSDASATNRGGHPDVVAQALRSFFA